MKAINKAVIEDIKDNNIEKKVKIKFNELCKNRNISLEMYKECADEYFQEVFKDNGKRTVLPNEHTLILHKILEKFQVPYFYQPGVVYEVSEEDADYYTSQFREVLENTVGSKTSSLLLTNVGRDLHRYKTKVFTAEVVND